MGKLTIVGDAIGEFKLDVMDIQIEFRATASSSSLSLKKVLSQCEKFLSILDEESIPKESIRYDDDSVDDRSYDDSENFIATRRIVIRLPFNIVLKNRLLEILSNNKFNYSIDSTEMLSNEQEIRQELIKKAIQNSREKADFVALNIDQKIIGVDIVNIENSKWVDFNLMDSMKTASCPSMPYSNQLSDPILKLSESVTVVWIME